MHQINCVPYFWIAASIFDAVVGKKGINPECRTFAQYLLLICYKVADNIFSLGPRYQSAIRISLWKMY